MTRLSGSTLTAWTEDNLAWSVLAEAAFADGTTYLWLGPLGQSVSYNGQTWHGTGDLVEMDGITETIRGTDARARARLYLDTDSELFADVDTDSAGRELKIHFVIVDNTTYTVTNPVTFTFSMGTVSYESEPDGNVLREYISLELIGPKAILARSHFMGMTDEEQQSIKSGDRGLQFVADPQIGTINAGERSSVSSSSGVMRDKGMVLRPY